MRKYRYLLLLLLFLGLSSCAGTGLDRRGRSIEERKLERILPGVTTKDEIIDVFGKPIKVVEKRGEGEELHYEYKEKKTPVYLGGLFIYEKGTKEKMVTLKVLIKNDVVESYHFKMKEEK